MANIIRRGDPSQVPSLLPRSSWDPFEMMQELLNLDRPLASGLVGRATFTPQFEVKETKNAYLFKADLPGVDEKDVDINLTGNRLTLSGHREAEQREETDRFFTYERTYGAFSRSFTLPEGIDSDHVNAEMKNGVLTLTVPKRPEHQPKKISIKSIAETVKGALGKDKASA